jgi:hypothetical protein
MIFTYTAADFAYFDPNAFTENTSENNNKINPSGNFTGQSKLLNQEKNNNLTHVLGDNNNQVFDDDLPFLQNMMN